VVAWSPLASGMLTGKYLPENSAEADSRLNTEMMKGFVSVDEARLQTVREVVAVAKEIDASPAQVALAWLRHRPVPVIPIVGARKLTQLEDNIASLQISFTAEQLNRLDQVSAVSLGYPHDLRTHDMVRSLAFGGMQDRIR
jgi:aryl-alcohol dehydrogenase-like predicted oxidoreductase